MKRLLRIRLDMFLSCVVVVGAICGLLGRTLRKEVPTGTPILILQHELPDYSVITLHKVPVSRSLEITNGNATKNVTQTVVNYWLDRRTEHRISRLWQTYTADYFDLSDFTVAPKNDNALGIAWIQMGPYQGSCRDPYHVNVTEVSLFGSENQPALLDVYQSCSDSRSHSGPKKMVFNPEALIISKFGEEWLNSLESAAPRIERLKYADFGWELTISVSGRQLLFRNSDTTAENWDVVQVPR